MRSLEDAYQRIKQAMDLIEQIPDDLYPGLDEKVSEAFNCLDDALGLIRFAAPETEGER